MEQLKKLYFAMSNPAIKSAISFLLPYPVPVPTTRSFLLFYIVSALISHLKSPTSLLPYSMTASATIESKTLLLLCLVLTFISCLESPTFLSSHLMPTLVTARSTTLLSPYFIPISVVFCPLSYSISILVFHS